MTFVLIGHATSTTPSGGVTINSVGADIEVLLQCSQSSTSAPTDSLGNIFAQIQDYYDGANIVCSLYWLANPTVSSSQIFTQTVGAGLGDLSVLAFSGGLSTASYDQHNGEADLTNTTAFGSGFITPTVPSTLVVTGIAMAGTGLGITSGWTGEDIVDFGASGRLGRGMAWQELASPTTLQAIWLWTSEVLTEQSCVIASFFPAPPPPPPSGAILWARSIM